MPRPLRARAGVAAHRSPAPEPREIQLPETGPPLPQAGEPGLRLLRRIAAGVDPESLDAYRAHGGYAALRRALELGPEGVAARGRPSRACSAAAAPPSRPGAKWEAVAQQPAQPHYLVCNADESEPGTFKDRVLMEGDPFALVEAMTIAAYATGCERGFVYVRAEYPLAHARLENAFAQARAHAACSATTCMGAGFAFDVELRIGAGAYVCGEETALFQSIEGYRGEPRNKPPFPVEVGLFGKPTVVNNVETLFNVLDVVNDSGAAYAATGTRRVDGHPALLPLRPRRAARASTRCRSATPLRDLLELAGARPPKAVLLGGAAGSFLRPDQLDLPLTFEDARAAGATLGSGVVIVYDESADLVDAVLRIAEFFRDESCGQCVPCRVGTVRQEEALHRLADGRGERQRARGARRPRAGDARRFDLRPRPDGRERRRIGDDEPRSARRMTAVSVAAPKRLVELTVDGQAVSVTEGSTILDACRRLGIETPTLCYADTLTPVNVCRVCVVEVEGARVLVPSCSRKVEPGMVVHTDSPRVRTSRRMVLELLGSSVDLSTAPDAQRYIGEYGARAGALRRRARPSRSR